ncbi:MAG: hypothetical protein MN733_10770 [Nitrososphaera sp.]|nr:hypothetical protein [Nitrososphaera sp.]
MRAKYVAWAIAIIIVSAAISALQSHAVSPGPRTVPFLVGEVLGYSGPILVVTAIVAGVIAIVPSRWRGKRTVPFLWGWTVLTALAHLMLAIGAISLMAR